MPRFSKWPPSETLTKKLCSSAEANSSFRRYHKLRRSEALLQHFFPGFGNHHARRTLNSVRSTATSGELLCPMFGLAAAPDTEIAWPRETPLAKDPDDRGNSNIGA